MNKYLSKAILYDRRFDALTIFLAILLLNSLQFNNYYTYINEFNSYRYEVLFTADKRIVFTYIILLVMLICNNKKEALYGHLLSMPKRKCSITFTYLVTSFFSIFSALFIYGIIASIVLFSTTNNLTTILNLWIDLATTFTVLICINSFFQYFQLIISNTIAAIVIPIFYLVITIPLILIVSSNFIIQRLFELSGITLNLFDKLNEVFLFIKTSIGIRFISSYSYIPYDSILLANENLIIIVSSLLLTVVFLYLSIKKNKMIKFESLSKFFIFKSTEKGFLILNSVFIYCTLILFIENSGIKGVDYITNKNLLIIYVVLIPIIFLFYKLLEKCWKLAAL